MQKITLYLLLITLLISCANPNQNETPAVIEKTDVDTISIDTVKSEVLLKDIVGEKRRFYYEPEKMKDGYWQRGTYFALPDFEEKVLHVKVDTANDYPRFYFIGSKVPKDSNDVNVFAKVYELDEYKRLHVIDSFPVFAFSSDGISNNEKVYFPDFMLRHYDNLIVDNGYLYYFKENHHPSPNRGKAGFEKHKSFFSYKLGSQSAPKAIPKEEMPPVKYRYMMTAIERAVFSPNLQLYACSDSYEIYFKKVKNLEKDQDSLMNHGHFHSFDVDTTIGEFRMAYHFPQPEDDGCAAADFGGMCWNCESSVLFFDNSSYCYACIWMIDVNTRKVTKIVPEHEAIHPFYFKNNNREMVAYVFHNRIMIAEPKHVDEERAGMNVAINSILKTIPSKMQRVLPSGKNTGIVIDDYNTYKQTRGNDDIIEIGRSDSSLYIYSNNVETVGEEDGFAVHKKFNHFLYENCEVSLYFHADTSYEEYIFKKINDHIVSFQTKLYVQENRHRDYVLKEASEVKYYINHIVADDFNCVD